MVKKAGINKWGGGMQPWRCLDSYCVTIVIIMKGYLVIDFGVRAHKLLHSTI